jgi:hypothetical protein
VGSNFNMWMQHPLQHIHKGLTRSSDWGHTCRRSTVKPAPPQQHQHHQHLNHTMAATLLMSRKEQALCGEMRRLELQEGCRAPQGPQPGFHQLDASRVVDRPPPGEAVQQQQSGGTRAQHASSSSTTEPQTQPQPEQEHGGCLGPPPAPDQGLRQRGSSGSSSCCSVCGCCCSSSSSAASTSSASDAAAAAAANSPHAAQAQLQPGSSSQLQQVQEPLLLEDQGRYTISPIK